MRCVRRAMRCVRRVHLSVKTGSANGPCDVITMGRPAPRAFSGWSGCPSTRSDGHRRAHTKTLPHRHCPIATALRPLRFIPSLSGNHSPSIQNVLLQNGPNDLRLAAGCPLQNFTRAAAPFGPGGNCVSAPPPSASACSVPPASSPRPSCLRLHPAVGPRTMQTGSAPCCIFKDDIDGLVPVHRTAIS